MKLYFQRAIKDIRDNVFLTGVTVTTIALSILIAAAFALFFTNTQNVINVWQQDIRMMVYLNPDLSQAARLDTKFRLEAIAGVREAVYISKTHAMKQLKSQMQHHSALLDSLKKNPLPDAFEVSLNVSARNSSDLQSVAESIESLNTVNEVEYGRQWIQRFNGLINLFSLAGYAIGGLFFLATVFIIANTIRLMLYSRRDEIEIMRLVGATDRFIKIPFYLGGMLQGATGTLIGLGVLFFGFLSITAHFQQSVNSNLLELSFFSPTVCLAIFTGGILVGWLGCLVSLTQFMKE
ncbi:MAG: ABC transporter permease [Desulfobacteraceae bacterium]|nr:ABC transporter permease [Desulfobacteraceae bacterium]